MHAKLVFQVLKARYFPYCAIVEVEVEHRTNSTWRSIISAKWVIEKGSHWLVGDVSSLNIREAKWLPGPHSFRVITPMKQEVSHPSSRF